MSFIYEPCPLIFGTVGEALTTADFTDSEYQLIGIYNASYDDTVHTTKWPFHKRTDGYITGTTIDETATPMGNVLITCLWNKNMATVSKTISDSVTGVWTIYGLDPNDIYGYTITAQDPTTGTVYNSVSYDKIIPAAPV